MSGTASAHLVLLVLRQPPGGSAVRAALRGRMSHLGARVIGEDVYLIPESEGALEHVRRVADEIALRGGSALLGRGTVLER